MTLVVRLDVGELVRGLLLRDVLAVAVGGAVTVADGVAAEVEEEVVVPLVDLILVGKALTEGVVQIRIEMAVKARMAVTEIMVQTLLLLQKQQIQLS